MLPLVKALVLQIRRLGDVLMTTPLLRSLKAGLPDTIVHVCLERSSVPAIQANPHVDAIVLSPGGASLRLVPRLRRENYDVVFDTLGVPASARLAFLTGAPVRIGPDRPWRRACYTHRCSDQPSTYAALEKLTYLEPLGLRTHDCRIELFSTADDARDAESAWRRAALSPGARVIAFAPAARRSDKRWPPERFAEVCDCWSQRESVVFLPVFGPGEEAQVESVVARSRRPDTFRYPCPVVPFTALPPLLARCDGYFGNDSGIRHAAIAAGIPTAAVFMQPDPVSWTPPAQEQHVTVGGRRAPEAVTVGEVDTMLRQFSLRLKDASGRRR
jgi:ADP-heptose:LPS heptosyltransferase